MQTVSPQTHIQITDTLDRFSRFYDHKDIVGIGEAIAPDISGFVTGSHEKIAGSDRFLKVIEREFSRCEAIRFSFEKTEIGAVGTVAWVTAEVVVTTSTNDSLTTARARLTAVLRGTGYAWQFVQFHLSLPKEQ